MAEYKETSGYCYNCQKRVLAKQEQASHTFWLLASVLTCGLFAVVWIISMLAKSGAPAKCVFCGSPVSTQMPATGNPARSKTAFGAITPTTKKSPSPLLLVAVAFAGLFAIGLVANLITSSMRSKQAETMTASAAKPPQVQTPATTPSPLKQSSKKQSARPKTKEQRIRAGVIEVNDENGEMRPFAVTCRLRLEQMEILTDPRFPKGVQVATFERCLELQGNAQAAAQEMSEFLRGNN